MLSAVSENNAKQNQTRRTAMKIAVLFPGIGYHCDKPLLYYSGKLAAHYQYELVKVPYTNLRDRKSVV